MDIDAWSQELIQELNNLEQPMSKIHALLTKKLRTPVFPTQAYETALKACNLCYLDPKVDGLRIVLEKLREAQEGVDK